MSLVEAASGRRFCWNCYYCLFVASDDDPLLDIHLCYTDECECEVCS